MKTVKKILVMSMAGAALMVFSGPSRADDKPANGDLTHYLQQLQVKLDHTAQRANQPTAEASSVVGVRGTKPEAASKQLYWKGKKGKAAVTPEEISLFRSGVDQAAAGKKDDAIVTLNSFQEKYPKSALLPDVQETLRRLSPPAAAAK